MKTTSILLFVALVTVGGFAFTASADDENNSAAFDCSLKYNLKGWSFFYKEANGTGTITCDNGETAKVRLQARGGGISFGKSEIIGGQGKFHSELSLKELYGVYGSAEAHAGATKSSHAQVVTKGDVSLALRGAGHGVDLGVAFGSFKIEPM
jgi:hypothetical protein